MPLIDVLRVNGVPYQSVSVYVQEDHGFRPVAGLQSTVAELTANGRRVVVRPDRNIDYAALIARPTVFIDTPGAVSEFAFDTHDDETPERQWVELSTDDCLAFVTKRVAAFLKEDVAYSKRRKIVVGVSGGGDSNALLYALLRSGRVPRERIVPVMMLGIPDWDKGLERARTVCESYGLSLRVVDAAQVDRLMGRDGSPDWTRDFERFYPDADLELIGTLAIRLALSDVARKERAQAIVTGLNQEDVLAECLLLLMRGEDLLPFPERVADGVRIWYPLYLCPKKIVDGCFPRFSLENYGDRYPSRMYWRAVAYYMAQQLHASLPGVENVFLEGFKSLAKRQRREPVYDPRVGFSVMEKLSNEAVAQWRCFINAGRRS